MANGKSQVTGARPQQQNVPEPESAKEQTTTYTNEPDTPSISQSRVTESEEPIYMNVNQRVTETEEPIYDDVNPRVTETEEPIYDDPGPSFGRQALNPTYESPRNVGEGVGNYDNIFGAGAPEDRMASDPQQAERAQQASSSLLRMTSTDDEIYATARAVPQTGANEPTPQLSQSQAKATTEEEADVGKSAEEASTDVAKSGGIDKIGLAGFGLGVYDELTSDDSATQKAVSVAKQTALYAGVEAVSAINPLAGAVAGIAVGVGSLIDDLIKGKREEKPAPLPQAPPPPTMAFSSSAVLDSSAYRQPLGAVGQ